MPRVNGDITMSTGRGASSGAQPMLSAPADVQISTAAALTLGLVKGRMYRSTCTHCLNLLLSYPEGCRANCSYCGLARYRDGSLRAQARNFIRVDWPTVAYEEVLRRVQARADGGCLQRMCISMVTHPRANADALSLLSVWRQRLPHIPVSILSNPSTMQRGDLVAFREAGADIFTVALDAATRPIFEHTRGRLVAGPHAWERYWRSVHWAAEVFGPGRFGVHLICGLGETDQELLEVVQRVRDLGGHSHLFAFFPERGSLMEAWPAVRTDQWRRVQLARYLIDFAGMRLEAMPFDPGGRLRHFGLPQGQLDAVIDSGRPFQTSGCPGNGESDLSACDRPYGDCSPADIRSYPFPLTPEDVAAVREQLFGNEGAGEGAGCEPD